MKRVLDTVVEACPGLLPALYRLADGRAAEATLRHVIDNVDPTFVDAYLLLARIRLDAGDGHQAAQHLEMGLSYNFEVRDHPLYHLLMARIQRTHRNDAEAALASLRTALVLAGMRPASAGAGQPVKRISTVSLFQRKPWRLVENVLQGAEFPVEAKERRRRRRVRSARRTKRWPTWNCSTRSWPATTKPRPATSSTRRCSSSRAPSTRAASSSLRLLH